MSSGAALWAMGNRPRYETPVDRDREEKVARYIAKINGTDMRKMRSTSVVDDPESWEPADFLETSRNHVVTAAPNLLLRHAIWEIKCRNYIWSFFENYGYMISERKMRHAFRVALLWNNSPPFVGSPIKPDPLPVKLCVRTLDPQLWVCTFKNKHDLQGVPMGMGGRKDRNDKRDIEPCYFIPASMFERIG